MAWPTTSGLSKDELDQTGDDPSQARAELEALYDKVVVMIGEAGTSANQALKLDSNANIPANIKAATNFSILPATTGGSATVYTATLGISSYETGRVYEVQIHTDNTSSATMNFDAIAAKSIKLLNGNDPLAGQLKDGMIARLLYDGTDLILLNPESISGPAFSVHLNGTPQNNITGIDKVLWTTEVFDTHDNFASNRFTPTVADRYLLSATALWNDIHTNSVITLYLYENGADYKHKEFPSEAGQDQSQTITAVVDANGTSDYYEIFAQDTFQNTSDILGGSAETFWTGCKAG